MGTRKKLYISFAVLGCILMAVGQFLSRPEYSGTELGRSWATIFWQGVCILGTIVLIFLYRSVAKNPNPLVVQSGKYQLIGMLSVTGLTALFAAELVITGDRSLLTTDGDARRGLLAAWLVLLITFTIINLSVLAIRNMRYKH